MEGGGEFNYSHSPSSEIDRTTLMMVRGGDTISGEMENSVVVDVAITALTHMEVPLPSGNDSLDGRPLAFEPNSENARVPDCPQHFSTTIVENSRSFFGVTCTIGIIATVFIFQRWKSIVNDE